MTAARQRKKGLTERQIKILQVLDRFQQKVGYPPTIREICEKTEISSTSVVNYYLDRLEDMGYIERDTHVSRGIRLIRPVEEVVPGAAVAPGQAVRKAAQSARQAVEEILRIPVMGRIFASTPVPMPATDFNYMDAESMISVARSMLPEREKPDNLFALEVRGDSMIDAMVYDGDIVIMKKAQDARNGEMVAVWLLDQDETTLKYFYKETNRIRLQPANPSMEPIYKDPKVVQVQGKVVMVIRSVNSKVN